MTAHGEKNLETLLASIDPVIRDGEFIVMHSHACAPMGANNVIWQGIEKEGVTSIVQVDADMRPVALFETERTEHQKWKMITLNVHSSLEAVGFLAELLPALAKADIPVNVLSGYFHDHLLVPVTKAADALSILKTYSKSLEE